jgi:hypothetical protein
VSEDEIAQAVIETVTHSGMQVEGKKKRISVELARPSRVLQAAAPLPHDLPPFPAPHPLPGATGVAVAAFHKLAPSMHRKHSVIIACGGNISRAGMEEVYRVAGRAPPPQ